MAEPLVRRARPAGGRRGPGRRGGGRGAPPAATPSPRAVAARTLAAVLSAHRSLSAVLADGASAAVAGSDRALVRELCYGALRWQPRLEALLKALLQRPLSERDADVHALLLLGLYQLAYLRIPPHAAVTETVSAAAALGKDWARGLVNGVLRRYQREREGLEAGLAADLSAQLAHPMWLLEALRTAWPEDWRRIAAAGNERPPMVLRVDARRLTRDAYVQRLAAVGMTARPMAAAPQALVLDKPVDVAVLPGFGAGEVSVQDAGAQLAATLLDLRPGQRVLDACAAPGGKTGHLLELEPGLAEVLAIDRDVERMQRVTDTLERLGTQARTLVADAGDPAAWWDGRPFDRILLDAPCSATGVIRRHPDIKVLRRAEDVAAMQAEQARLLDALWPLLDKQGMLMYVTCSVLPQENEQQIVRFLSAHPEAVELPIDASWGRSCAAGRQILSGEGGMDGFYYARLHKNGND
jgi:16S rRNA (cytosine967-C5)-methyltransferase